MIKLIGDVGYLLRVKGFRHGAAAETRDTANSDSDDYNRGYDDGQKSREEYIRNLNDGLISKVFPGRSEGQS